MQRQSFDSHSPKLLAHLRDALRNDFISIKAIINPDKEIVKPLSPQEFLEKTVRVNSRLANFLKDLEIEIDL